MLSLIVFLPLVGALLVLLAGGRGDRPEREPLVRNIALAISLLTFAATLVLWWRFDPTSADYQFVETHAWMPVFGIQYLIGVDGISLFLIVLTGFLTPLALLSSWESVHKNVKLFSFFLLRSRPRCSACSSRSICSSSTCSGTPCSSRCTSSSGSGATSGGSTPPSSSSSTRWPAAC